MRKLIATWNKFTWFGSLRFLKDCRRAVDGIFNCTPDPDGFKFALLDNWKLLHVFLCSEFQWDFWQASELMERNRNL